MEIEDCQTKVVDQPADKARDIADTDRLEEVMMSQKSENLSDIATSKEEISSSAANASETTSETPTPVGMPVDDSDDDGDDNLNSMGALARRKPTAILSDDDDEETGVGSNTFSSGVANKSVLSSDDEDGERLFKKRIHQRPAVDSSSDSDDGMRIGSPSKTPWSPLPTKVYRTTHEFC